MACTIGTLPGMKIAAVVMPVYDFTSPNLLTSKINLSPHALFICCNCKAKTISPTEGCYREGREKENPSTRAGSR